MYNKEPAAAAAETAAAEMAAAETAAAIYAPDVSEQTDTADVVKRKREVNRTADAEVCTLQAENLHNIRVIEFSVLAQNRPVYWFDLSKL